MSERRDQETVKTLQDVSLSGLSKALTHDRHLSVPGIHVGRKDQAPACGVAAVLEEGDDEPVDRDEGDQARDVAACPGPDTATEWFAEEVAFDDGAGDDFCWEEDEEADDADLVRILLSQEEFTTSSDLLGVNVTYNFNYKAHKNMQDLNAELTIDVRGTVTDEDEKLAKRQAQAAQTRMRRILHRVSVLVWLARGMAMDGAADTPAVQARILSLVGDDVPAADAATLQSPGAIRNMQKAAKWMSGTFELCDSEDQAEWGAAQEAMLAEIRDSEGEVLTGTRTAPTTQRAAARLLLCIEAQQGTEEQLGALFVALLRAQGYMARHTVSLPVVPRRRQLKFTKPATGTMKQAMAPSPVKMQGKAKIIVAQPPAAEKKKPPKKGLKRKHSSDGGEGRPSTSTKAQGGEAGDCTSAGDANKKPATARVGDDEFERQLQMAMMATSEEQKQRDARRGAAASTSRGSANRTTGGRYTVSASATKRTASMFWAEVFCGAQDTGAWMHVDGVSGQVDRVAGVEASGRTGPVLSYVLAFTAAGVKDVTRRYTKDFQKCLKGRDETWFQEVVAPIRAKAAIIPSAGAQAHAAAATTNPLPAAAQGATGAAAGHSASVQRVAQLAELAEKREDAELEQAALKQRQKLPTSIEGFKKHPLYVLKRHIEKYQGLRPGTGPLGLHRGEPYFDRSELSDLHSAVQWKRKGREVLPGDIGQPCKLIAHGKKGKAEAASNAAGAQNAGSGSAGAEAEGTDADEGPQGRTTEVYGIWQTQPWAPPTAKNGIVPRNDYGNVEVPPLTSILPLGTVHIEIPQAAAAAAQLEVDAAPALVGFEAGRQGKMVAQFRGVVVCIDYEEAVREAANAILDAQRQQAQERRMAKGKTAWLQLIAAVHERIKVQRDVDEAARCQQETRAGDLEPADEQMGADGNAECVRAQKGRVNKKKSSWSKESKKTEKMGGVLRRQLNELANNKGDKSARSSRRK